MSAVNSWNTVEVVRPQPGQAMIWGVNARRPMVWTKEDGLEARYTCGEEEPNWFPLQEDFVVAFDEAEDAVGFCEPTEDSPDDPACAPLATQRLRGGPSGLNPPFNSGWIYLNLSHDSNGAGFGGNVAQSYVATLLVQKKLRSILPAISLTSACGGSQ